MPVGEAISEQDVAVIGSGTFQRDNYSGNVGPIKYDPFVFTLAIVRLASSPRLEAIKEVKTGRPGLLPKRRCFSVAGFSADSR